MKIATSVLAAALVATLLTSAPVQAQSNDPFLRSLMLLLQGKDQPAREGARRGWNDDDDDGYRQARDDDDDDRGRDDDDDNGGGGGGNDDDD